MFFSYFYQAKDEVYSQFISLYRLVCEDYRLLPVIFLILLTFILNQFIFLNQYSISF
jgi:hypothetical protein